jgi:hypothetical protein
MDALQALSQDYAEGGYTSTQNNLVLLKQALSPVTSTGATEPAP